VAAQPAPEVQASAPEQTPYCRTPQNDALNCLYLQLRLLGYRETYEAFREKVAAEPGSLTLHSLATIGRQLGFRLAPVRINVTELANAGAPVIVHLEEGRLGSGRFALVLGMDKEQTSVGLVDGSRVTREEIPLVQFRRYWTGYALLPRASIAWEDWMRRGAVALALGGVSLWLLRRTRPALHRLSSAGARAPTCPA
jgi:ABC-type bacteriocin/lantibiotic exporter with double-glycine peptidase domain